MALEMSVFDMGFMLSSGRALQNSTDTDPLAAILTKIMADLSTECKTAISSAADAGDSGCKEPSGNIDICSEGTGADCALIQEGIDNFVCEGKHFSAWMVTAGCTQAEGDKAATTLTTSVYDGIVAECPGGKAKNKCLSENGGSLSVKAALESGISPAAGLVALAGISLAAASMLA
jgi:hypothetical protein